ncbi:SusC/RagA family TonB-linked outer membrane protein [Foetidibacter luteolus]|uniref:SusC/RagA family TonB-linked outer membrane protein n=1 Tax=Foetidibacter luteolus TaxID=2608880 RepID=UPI00129B89F6|nr:TonB-dependent receptor [Foetidibacter luteolus]
MRRLFTMLAVLLVTAGFAQQRRVTGRVTDKSSSAPLSGVSVQSKKEIVTTDSSGRFSITADVGETLNFSYVGMQPFTATVPASGQITIALEAGANDLTQIVVTGYQTQRKVDVIGAVAVVDMKPVKNNSSGNPMQALQGRVPGLYIEKNGTPSGENSRIVIRGVNTLGNTDPLYIIDGVPTKRPQVFQSLTGGAIESVQILKDASAASIYGSRASNGVIIVTTRNGSNNPGGKLNVQVNSSLTRQSVTPQKLTMLNAEDRGRALWQAAVNDRTDPNTALSSIYQYDWNGDYDKPVLSKVNIQPFVGGDQNVPVGNTDWQDEVYDAAMVSNNEVTISGGTKASSLLMSLGYFNNAGVMKYTGYRRYSARLNAATQFYNGRLKFGMNSQFASSDERLPTTDLGGAPTPSLAITLAPTIPVFTKDGKYAGPAGAGYSDRNNPVNMQWLNRWDNRNRTFAFGNVYADFEIIKHLNFRTTFGVEYATSLAKDIQLSFQEGFLGRSVNSLSRSTDNFLSLTWSNTLNYLLELGQHRITMLAGVEAVRQKTEAFGAYRENFAQQTEDFFNLDAGSGRSTNFGRASSSRLYSQFGKIGYSYANKYLASVTLRRDGSSRFGADNRYGFFPAANLGWNIINESFMRNAKAFSSLKLRAGVGRVGNQDIGDFASFGLFQPRYGTLYNNGVGFPGQWLNVGTAYDLAGVNTGSLPSGFVSIQAANPALKWETTEEINLGVDFGFMNEKLFGSFDYFSRKTTDILIQPPLASAVGEGRLKWVNGATKQNKGFEFILGYRQSRPTGFSYTIQANLARFRDKITELPEEVRTAYPGNAEKNILGHSELSIFGYRTAGIFQSQAEVDAHANQVGKGVGRIRYVDLNNDGEINSFDQDWLGTILPAYEYGLRVDLSYKNFDFSIFGSGVTGRYGLDPYILFNNFIRVRENVGPGVFDAWTPQNTSSTIPMLTQVDANTEGKTSDYFFINTSYFKLRNMQLGYNAPASAISRLHMSQLRLFFMGENLFWIKSKKYQGKDPEVSNLDFVPVPTSFTFGVNITFN